MGVLSLYLLTFDTDPDYCATLICPLLVCNHYRVSPSADINKTFSLTSPAHRARACLPTWKIPTKTERQRPDSLKLAPFPERSCAAVSRHYRCRSATAVTWWECTGAPNSRWGSAWELNNDLIGRQPFHFGCSAATNVWWAIIRYYICSFRSRASCGMFHNATSVLLSFTTDHYTTCGMCLVS